MTTTGPQYIEPNVYHLQGKDLSIQYSATSIAGVPILTFHYKNIKKSYRGDQIAVCESPMGRLVTVMLESIPDLHVIKMTLIIPGMNLDKHDGSIASFAVITTSRTSIGGPRLVHGQLDRYETIDVTGTAQAAVF